MSATARQVTIRVIGIAATKGAVKPVPIWRTDEHGQKRIVGSRLTEDSKRSRPWQAAVRDAARQTVRDVAIPFPAEIPVAVQLVFWLPAPKSIPKTKPSAPIGQRSDLDKLEGGILDALTSVVGHKRRAWGPEPPGRRMVVRSSSSGCAAPCSWRCSRSCGSRCESSAAGRRDGASRGASAGRGASLGSGESRSAGPADR